MSVGPFSNRHSLWRLLGVAALVFIFCSPAQAIERNQNTGRFEWGDDLNTSYWVGGATASSLQIKPQHLPQIRDAITKLDSDCPCTASNPWFYTDAETISQIGSPGAPITSAQLNNLRRAIEEIYRQCVLPTPSAILGNVLSGEPIDKPHVQDMRSALDDMAATCPIGGVCGDGVLNAGEQCDDSNTTSGDGCTATCQTESTCTLGPAAQEGATSCPGPDQKYPVCDAGWGEGTVVTLPSNRLNAQNKCYLPFECGPYLVHDCSAGGCVPDGGSLPAMGVCQWPDVRRQGPVPDPTGQCCSGMSRQHCAAYQEPWEITCVAANTCGSCEWVWNGLNWDDYCTGNCFCIPTNMVTPPGPGDPTTTSCDCTVCSGASLCWQHPSPTPQVCEVSGTCGPLNATVSTKCEDAGGNMQAGHTLYCLDTASGDPCVTAPTCLPAGGTFTFGGPAVAPEQCASAQCCSGLAICSGNTGACIDSGGGAVCGNGSIEAGEACDSGAANGACPSACSNSCATNVCGGPAVCGNGIAEAGEACDNGGSNGVCPAACSSLCTLNACGGGAVCGNGSVESGEACDEGGANADCPTAAACSTSCTFNNCGGAGGGAGGGACGGIWLPPCVNLNEN